MSAKCSAYEEQMTVIQEIKGVPGEYLPNLIPIIRLFRENVALKPAEASFHKG